MKLLKYILLVVSNLTMVANSNYLIKHLSSELISWCGVPCGSLSDLAVALVLSNENGAADLPGYFSVLFSGME